MNNPVKVLFIPHANLHYSQLRPEKRAWVVQESYNGIFDLVEKHQIKVPFEASGYTIDFMARNNPKVMKKLIGLMKAGLVEPIASPEIHIMLTNIDPEVGCESLKKSLDTWEKSTGFRPEVGWNPECGWVAFLPEIYKEAGFKTLVMDSDSFYLSFEEIRQATGIAYDVRGHSNKNSIDRIDDYLKENPEYYKYTTSPLKAPNGLQLIFRSDIVAGNVWWYCILGEDHEHFEKPITIEAVKQGLVEWQDIVQKNGGTYFSVYANDAEYFGTSAYFWVKQFDQPRFFEPIPEGIARLEEIFLLAREVGLEFANPRDIFKDVEEIPVTDNIYKIENGCAWHGGTALAWKNTEYSRLLDPTCQIILNGIKCLAEKEGKTLATIDGDLRIALEKLTSAYVSDSRWPPAPSTPGRFNVKESIQDLKDANEAIGRYMAANGFDEYKSYYSTAIVSTQIAGMEEELMALPYCEETVR